MYDIISEIINHAWVSNDSTQQYIMYICCALIPLLTVVFIDVIKIVFAQFLRK